jgi:type IV pilus assembly protein PilC
MAAFVYTARDGAGNPVSGTIQADSQQAASQQLRAEGKFPTAIRPADTPATTEARPTVRGIKIARADVINLSQQLSIMVETGVTLTEALDCIAAQTDKPNLKRLVEDLSKHVQGGGDFSAALARHPRSFPRLFIALIKAAEKSGMLAKLLVRATNYLRDEQETMRRVKGALTYPAMMLAFAVTTTIFLLVFVLPRFTAIYASKAAALPVPTRILMNLSQGIIDHWVLLLMLIGAGAVGGYFYLRSEGGARVWHYVQLRMPLLGSMFRKLHLSRGLRTVGTMSNAGIGLVDCVQTAHDLCGNSYYRDMWDRVAEQIQQGKQFSEPLFEPARCHRCFTVLKRAASSARSWNRSRASQSRS